VIPESDSSFAMSAACPKAVAIGTGGACIAIRTTAMEQTSATHISAVVVTRLTPVTAVEKQPKSAGGQI
jgi:hypothetical protein